MAHLEMVPEEYRDEFMQRLIAEAANMEDIRLVALLLCGMSSREVSDRIALIAERRRSGHALLN